MKLKINYRDTILKESIFIIGLVSSVEGRKVKIKVKKDKNLSHLSYKGKIIKNVSVGSYVKISKGFIEIIGKVEGEYTTKEKVINHEYNKEEMKISRYLDVSLFGHFERNRFKQGIKEMPLIDNECYLLDKDEFNKLHQFYKSHEKTIKVGALTEEPSQEIKISIAKLFASHIGIFGNTGSGKSNTLAKIYTALFDCNKDNARFKSNSRFVVIDFNGEYTKDDLITRNKKVYNLSARRTNVLKYPIKHSNIERLEIIAVLLEATEKTQKPFLDRAIKNTYLNDDFTIRIRENITKIVKEILQKGDQTYGVNILAELFNQLRQIEKGAFDSPVNTILNRLRGGDFKFHSLQKSYYYSTTTGDVYSNSALEQLFSLVFGELQNLNITETSFEKIKCKILSQYYREIISGYTNQEHIRPIMGRMFKKFEMLEKLITIGSEVDEQHIEIVNLKDVNLEMKKTLPLIIVKQLYDEHKEKDEFEKKSLHIIIDEAHNILSTVSERESETWKDYRLETFEEIIKEGRKFSTFLTLSSQRPYDISPTIISQLHNYFIHRLINENDIKAVEKAVAYLDKLSFESIPVLSVGSCFIAGLASDIPVKVDIELLPHAQQPKSETIDFNTAWEE